MKKLVWFLAAGVIAGLCNLTGCTSNSSFAPSISSFVANPVSTTSGGTVGLTGSFTNGTGVISPGNIPVTSGTAVTVSPTATTTYMLTVTGVSKAATQTVTVTVDAGAPTITSFTANPATIAAGDSSHLTAAFANGTGVITPGNITITSGTAVSVSPTATTTYTLTVTGGSKTATQTVTVTVNSTTGWYTHIDCEGGTPGAKAAQGGANEFTEAFSSTVYSNTQVGTGSESCQMGITQGSDGWGQWGGIYTFPTHLTAGDSLWARVSVYVPSTFNYTASPWLKFMRIHTASPTSVNQGYIDLYIVPPAGTIWDAALKKEVATPYAFYYEGNAIVRGVGAQPANDIVTNQWETYEIYYHLDTVSKDAGGAGEVRIWKNNQLLADLTDQATLADSATYAEALYLFTYWNGNAPATQSLYIDDVTITNQTPANTDANGYPFIGTPIM